MKIGRRAFLRKAIFAGAFLGAGTAAYASGYERHDLEITRVPLALGLARPMRTALVSDIHFDPLYETDYLARVFERLTAAQPDLVLFAGDFVTRTTARFEEFGVLAAQLRPPLGTYAALGNHDHWTDKRQVTAILERSGIRVLANAAVPLPGQPGWFLSGLESFWGGRPDPGLFARFPADAKFLSIVHEPDAWDQLPDPRIRLQLSGHTHGGQVCAPFIGALRLPAWGQRYAAGLYRREDGRCLYVNRGLGTIGVPVRFDCRPELTLFDLS